MTPKYFLTAMALLVYGGLCAQSSTLIFFSEEGEKFILFIDGDRKNGAPEARVIAEGIDADFVQAKIKFQAGGVPDLTKQMMVESGKEMTTIIRKNKKGRYVLRPVSSVPVGTAGEVSTATQVIASPAPETTSEVTKVTTTTTTNQPPQNESDNASIGISVSDGENSFNLNVDVGITGNTTDVEMTEESTTTTTTTTTTYNEPAPSTLSACSAMNASDFDRAKASISKKSFAEEKMTVMKQILKANCVSVKQVVGFVALFTYEDDKLEVAKTAYARTTDRGNYYQVNDALTYSESIEELNRFLETQ